MEVVTFRVLSKLAQNGIISIRIGDDHRHEVVEWSNLNKKNFFS